MEKRIKLIWDFRGPDALKTAEHHQIHLKEFADKEQLDINETSSEKLSDVHSIATMIVSKNELIKVRDALRPHRGVEVG